MNKELMPGGVNWMKNEDGSMAKVEKLSDYLVKWTFSQPNTAFLLNMANLDGADLTRSVLLSATLRRVSLLKNLVIQFLSKQLILKFQRAQSGKKTF